MVKYEGYWNTIRKTMVAEVEDRNGKRFNMRFLVDSGASVSLIPLNILWQTKGEWDLGQAPNINLCGVNTEAPLTCNLVCEAKLKPASHIKSSFRTLMKVDNEFEVKVKFLVQPQVKSYASYKYELPEDIRNELNKNEFHMADPEQKKPGESRIFIHGILGEDFIDEIGESKILRVGSSSMKVTRSKFGDLLHGKSHFIYYPYKDSELKLKQPLSQDGLYSAISCYGYEAVPVSKGEVDLNTLRYYEEICQ